MGVILPSMPEDAGGLKVILSMSFKAESSRPSGANSPLWSPKTARQRRTVFGLDSNMRSAEASSKTVDLMKALHLQNQRF